MDKPDRHDESMKRLFDSSRNVDRATLPGYRAVRDARPSAERRPAALRLLTLGFGTLTASVALAAMAFVLVHDAYRSEPSRAGVVPPPPTRPAIVIAQGRANELELDRSDPAKREQRDALGYVAGSKDPAAGTTETRTEPILVPNPPAPPKAKPVPIEMALRPTDRVAVREAEQEQRRRIVAPPSPRTVADGDVPAKTQAEVKENALAEFQRSGKASTLVASTDLRVPAGQEFVKDLPVPSRFYQNVVSLEAGIQESAQPGSRARDFKAVVGGVASAPGSAPSQGSFVAIVEPETSVASREAYDLIEERDFVTTADEALSTFSIDVDTAAYANVRRYLEQGLRPPRDAVRIEELINYFDYDYPEPSRGEPFSTTVEVAGCPWNEAHRLVRIGIKGREGGRAESRGSNLVFLIDVSGSMRHANKLPLLKQAFRLLVEQLGARDQVAIVVYAGSSGMVLPSTSGADADAILEAIGRLEAGGSTNGGAGIDLAYTTAVDHLIPGGVNRVVLATDGDFNVGTTDRAALLERIRQGAADGVSLTALGFGMGNLQDGMLETLADKGDGNYFYIDTEREARKVLVEELQGTLVTIAKDVKIQVEFNPAEVEAYRLIGYENRALAKQDFNDDTKDAGEIGSGHTVTALYEIVPAGNGEARSAVDALKYQRKSALSREAESGELLTVKLRYKRPDETKSRLLEVPVRDDGLSFDKASADFRFAAAVAAFGMVLRDSEHRGNAGLASVTEILERQSGPDKHGYRAEFHDLVLRSRTIEPR